MGKKSKETLEGLCNFLDKQEQIYGFQLTIGKSPLEISENQLREMANGLRLPFSSCFFCLDKRAAILVKERQGARALWDFVPFVGKTTTNVEITNGVAEITIAATVKGAIRGDIENAATLRAQAVLGNLPAQFNYGA
jgi:hypothetical protein